MIQCHQVMLPSLHSTLEGARSLLFLPVDLTSTEGILLLVLLLLTCCVLNSISLCSYWYPCSQYHFFLNYSRIWWWENSWGQVRCLLVLFGSVLFGRVSGVLFGVARLAECRQWLDFRFGGRYLDWVYDELGFIDATWMSRQGSRYGNGYPE